jgi:hypothetical protein
MFLPLSFSRLFYKNHHGVDRNHSVCLPKQQISARRWRVRREGTKARRGVSEGGYSYLHKIWIVIASRAKQSRVILRGTGLLRFARNDE